MQRQQTQRSRSVASPSDEVLPRHGEGNPDLQDELLLMEMTILRAFQAHQRLGQGTKQKIVAALRSRQ